MKNNKQKSLLKETKHQIGKRLSDIISTLQIIH